MVRGRGTWPSTAWPSWDASIRPSPRYQLVLLCREWFQHPNGVLPAYEWELQRREPAVQAWAVLEVFAIDGATDVDFLSRVSTSCS